MLEVRELSLRAGTFQVHQVSFTVAAGGAHVLLGPTGTGKTLLLEAIAGLRPIEGGKVILGGQDRTSTPPELRGLAYVPQDLALFPHLRVADNILFSAKVRGRLDDVTRTEARELMGLLKIEALADRWPRSLSGGERQRVALARALASGNRLLLLDEPFAALNASLRGELWMMLKELQASLGLTLLMVTHDLTEAFFLADHISVLIDGRVQQSEAKDRIYHRPRTVPVAQYLGIRNLFEGTVVGHSEGLLEVDCQGLGRTLQVAGQEEGSGWNFGLGVGVVLAIRSDEVKVVRPEFEQAEPHNLFRGRIEAAYSKGAGHTLVFRPGTGPSPAVELDLGNQAMRKLGLSQGAECSIAFRPEAISLLPPP